MNERIFVTGATGFLGKAVVSALANNSREIIEMGRRFSGLSTHFYESSLNASSNYSDALCGVSLVIHMAAKTSHTNDESINTIDSYREINTAATISLAEQAAKAGVKRFIFISSIKVNGDSTKVGFPFKFDDTMNPTDPYGRSKAEAEIGLREISQRTGMEIVIIRPPLVYGKGVKANFATMIKLSSLSIPLPLGSISNKRSLCCVTNLVDLILVCMRSPYAANQTFLVSDNEDVSTSELFIIMKKAAGRNSTLLPMPISIFKLVGKLLGKKSMVDKLCGNLQVDIQHTKKTLGWQPPVSLEEGILQCFRCQ